MVYDGQLQAFLKHSAGHLFIDCHQSDINLDGSKGGQKHRNTSKPWEPREAISVLLFRWSERILRSPSREVS